MKPLCVFYHAILSGGTIPIDTGYAAALMGDQMEALKLSGLMDACDEFYVGVNGGDEDASIARMLAPAKAKMLTHGPGTTTEIPTLKCLAGWAASHPDSYVMYHHIKGVTHPYEAVYAAWRQRMENAVVWGWRNCVADLEAGYDSAGAHWLTPEQFPTLVQGTPFWGGTFWWARADYLMTLPPLPAPTWQNRYEAERWIGQSPTRAHVHDYCPGWP
ncbi:MAG TPA: hypothetical protein VMQ76_02740 [Terracidiphilus sp.]|nr:hypothetical protein [Terracidiphilus sp.]